MAEAQGAGAESVAALASAPPPPADGLARLGRDLLVRHLLPQLDVAELAKLAATSRTYAHLIERLRNWTREYEEAFPSDAAALPPPNAGLPAPTFGRFARRAAGREFVWGYTPQAMDQAVSDLGVNMRADPPPAGAEVRGHGSRAHRLWLPARNPRVDIAIREVLSPFEVQDTNGGGVDAARAVRGPAPTKRGAPLRRSNGQPDWNGAGCGHVLCTRDHGPWTVAPDLGAKRDGVPRLPFGGRRSGRSLQPEVVPADWTATTRPATGGPVATGRRIMLSFAEFMALLPGHGVFAWVRGGATPRGEPPREDGLPGPALLTTTALPDGDSLSDIGLFGPNLVLLSTAGRLYTVGDNPWQLTGAPTGGAAATFTDEETGAQLVPLLVKEGLRFRRLVHLNLEYTLVEAGRGRYAFTTGTESMFPKELGIAASLSGPRVVQSHTAIGLTVDGEVWYVEGLGSRGPLQLDRVSVRRVPGLEDVVDIRGRRTSWLAVDRRGRVFTAGSNDDGAAGGGADAPFDYIADTEAIVQGGLLPVAARVEPGPRRTEFRGKHQFFAWPRRVPLPGRAIGVASAGPTAAALVVPGEFDAADEAGTGAADEAGAGAGAGFAAAAAGSSDQDAKRPRLGGRGAEEPEPNA